MTSPRPVPAWCRVWRVGRVELSSPLQVDVAEQRLRGGLTDQRAWTLPLVAPPETRAVVGTVRNGKVRLTTQHGMRNAGRPQLTGRLSPTADGCRLSGRLGLIPLARVLFPLAVAGLIVATLVTAVLLVVSLVEGTGVGSQLLKLAFLAPLTTVFLVAAVQDAPEGLADGAFLHEWVRQRLLAG